ncbi:hypothetical protein [Acinetobacter baumannii]|uniref:hypothetical protein n=1 Tax=Acinetobacter baumannii TaxID=470 RepID=UPI001F30870F|nr:hypothetical protein [Acinetobacter baumannii]MCF1300936.1 hypothetical protein [Acinetobacter baumannii]MDC4481532.1 hypothetical protein [Acinetobacter baumannii]MDC4481537.1 hypothetical protein [Acinetobacter baumannii]
MKNNKDQKNIKTCKNTQESPLISSENSLIGNPIYNMRETIDNFCTKFPTFIEILINILINF